jgi:hypothetical protein
MPGRPRSILRFRAIDPRLEVGDPNQRAALTATLGRGCSSLQQLPEAAQD